MPTTALRVACAALVFVLLPGCSDGSDGSGDEAAGAAPAGSSATAAEGEGGEFSLLIYNVAGLPAEISTVDPAAHIPMISPLVDPYDLVLTQEDFDWWGELAGGFDFVNYHDRLRAQATHPYKSAKHPGPEAVGLDTTARPAPLIGDGQGIMSRFPFADERRVPWVGCFGGIDTSDGGAADCLAMKGFAVATVTLADGMEVDVYTLHVEAGGTETDQALQADQAGQLASFIADHSAGRAVIVGGDTNLHTGGDHPDGGGAADSEIWERFLADTGLADACAATDCPDPSNIDKVAFRSSDAMSLTALSHDVPADRFVDPAGEPLSDHDPVVVDFAWQSAR